ncbi:DUF1003 domain-containing protein [Yersinia nurmii]|uniref:DUF1003 domain-containing protein n=1 Tax=Yersinia nurmii TaxID=685706 RepID=A0AAW7JYV6_9GAMM|nr:DUF1003 domain-containing protein [Yersinia nurmii]MDN0086861.1 DUF1003 domain-containing protein [Yersinia nurmii]CNE27527.1 Predicted membrane protein [Yersinia nurmii]
MNSSQTEPTTQSGSGSRRDYLRFHRTHEHLSGPFGNGWFALKAEAFARFFGTPLFLGAQTLIVVLWIGANVLGFTKFDIYPFILLNLAFSLQAAYAAPLILLAQTRQAERDKANAEADAQHREALAIANEERQKMAATMAEQMLELLRQNTELTKLTHQLAAKINASTMGKSKES